MAHYVQIPKDLNDIKQKFMFGLTKRQVVSFGIGGVMGIPLFFLTRGTLGVSGAIFVMGAVAAPALICGLYKKKGIFLEQPIKKMFRKIKHTRNRPYRTVNLYECIERQIEYNKLKRLLNKIERGK